MIRNLVSDKYSRLGHQSKAQKKKKKDNPRNYCV